MEICRGSSLALPLGEYLRFRLGDDPLAAVFYVPVAIQTCQTPTDFTPLRLLVQLDTRIDLPSFCLSGIRFPQNPCTSCPYIGLCLGRPDLTEAVLTRPTCYSDSPSLAALSPGRDPGLGRTERDTRFVICEVRAGQYWRLEKLKS